MQINSIKSQSFKGIFAKVKNTQSEHTFYFYHPYKDETYDMTLAAKQLFKKQLIDIVANNNHFIIGKKLKITRAVHNEIKQEGVTDDEILNVYL